MVANVNSTYLVLTSSSLLEPGMNYIVRLSDEVQTEAAFVCRNTASGIGIVSINASKLTAEQRNSIAVAQLDNSYMVKQGDLVIASGKLYETRKACHTEQLQVLRLSIVKTAVMRFLRQV